MMFRKFTILLASAIFLLACYTLYSALDVSITRRRQYQDKEYKDLNELENRLKQLEAELGKNERIINEVRANVAKSLQKADRSKTKVVEDGVTQNKLPLKVAPMISTKNASLSDGVCSFSRSSKGSQVEVQMLDVYDSLAFDNIDGGVWKQGWNIVYDKNSVQKSPTLNVYVVPHSHTDPGWIKTFEIYYKDQTRSILDNMVTKLPQLADMKFIYAEMTFFERWWRDIDDKKRSTVKQLLKNGQFEIVTGAWVMTDEANSHYFAMIDQMIEGHQWLENHLDYKPTNHWSIDPFGLTSTLSYLLKMSNFSTMTIQRVHYNIKKYLAQQKKLEFKWRPLWSTDDKKDIFCHLFPFYSYDIPHTCGPDPKICCQFDFRRLPGFGISCPWHIAPVVITEDNLEERAATLLDQYRKQAELYRTNVLLIPLGDDFRYDNPDEWNSQYDNYKKLFAYMNGRKDWNVQAQFGTLEDYYVALNKRTATEKMKDFPILSGDFFTYADRDDHYWSGYFTSRPFYKRMDRVLQNHLRGADILFTLATATAAGRAANSDNFPVVPLFTALVHARRNLGLFQHHDGITGTAKEHVVVDYGQRMWQSLMNCRKIISASINYLLTKNHGASNSINTEAPLLEFDDRLPSQDSLGEKVILNIDAKSPKTIVVYNSLAQTRYEVYCVHTDTAMVEVRDGNDTLLPIQVGPIIYKDKLRVEVSSTIFEVCWIADIPPVGAKMFKVYRTSTINHQNLATLKSNIPSLSGSVFSTQALNSETFELQTPYYGAVFNAKSGYLKSVRVAGNDLPVNVNLEFVQYGTTANKDKSGAYIFLPDGPAKPLNADNNRVIVVDGSLFAAVHVMLDTVKHTVRLYRTKSATSQSIDISNLVDIREQNNYELVMRFKSDIKNHDQVFYTDLNGFQVVKRKYFEKIPLQGNVYPMATSAFIDDGLYRMSLLSAQPLGATSLEVGWLEVFLDRRLMQDDNRGLFQTVVDNKVTPNIFKLVLEKLTSSQPDTHRIAFNSLTAHYASLALLYPPFTLYSKDTASSDLLSTSFGALRQSLPCDVHLVNLRTLEHAQDYAQSRIEIKPQADSALIFFRFGVECINSAPTAVDCTATDGQIALEHLLNGWTFDSALETSLTLMHTRNGTSSMVKNVSLSPMDIKTLRVRLK